MLGFSPLSFLASIQKRATFAVCENRGTLVSESLPVIEKGAGEVVVVVDSVDWGVVARKGKKLTVSIRKGGENPSKRLDTFHSGKQRRRQPGSSRRREAAQKTTRISTG
ncbi:hypothetical protein L1887_25625 [Cichorium endivia]|nr:hypothetical protein L1887_25625 [Cichorium endivia]